MLCRAVLAILCSAHHAALRCAVVQVKVEDFSSYLSKLHTPRELMIMMVRYGAAGSCGSWQLRQLADAGAGRCGSWQMRSIYLVGRQCG